MNGNAPSSIFDRLRTKNPDAAPAKAPAPQSEPTTGPVLPGEPDPFEARMNRPVKGTSTEHLAPVVAPGQINPPEFQAEPVAATAAKLPSPVEGLDFDKNAPPPPETSPELPGNRFRRTKDEMTRGLTVEQARAERAGVAQIQTAIAPKSEPGDIAAAKGSIGALTAARESAPTEATASALKAMGEHVPPPVEHAPAPMSAERRRERLEGIPERKIPVLFINCAPMSGSYCMASALAAKANAKICAERKISDYRYIEYGAGPGCLRAVVMTEIDAAPEGTIPPIMVDTSTPEGATLANDLEARARQTIRGFR